MSKNDWGTIAFVALAIVLTLVIYNGIASTGVVAFLFCLVVGTVIAGGVVGAAMLGLDAQRKLRD